MSFDPEFKTDPRYRPGEEPPPPIRVAISGASGRVGYGLAFQLASGALFGFRQSISLSLLETPGGMKRLQGMQLELTDCAFPLLDDVRVSDDPDEAFADADWILMLAGQAPKAGMSRLDLVRTNGPIYVEHGQAINRVAAASKVLTVAEPCNTNCRIAMKNAPNVQVENWFALNQLDRMRATSLIAQKAGVAVTKVNRVTVWGNHSERIFPDFHNAYIVERPAHQVITDRDWPRKVLEPMIANRERELSAFYGGTASATAIYAILGTIRSIITPTPPRRRFGAAVRSNGQYGVPMGLIFGFPLRTDGETWSVVDGLYIDDYAEKRLNENIEELERESVVANV